MHQIYHLYKSYLSISSGNVRTFSELSEKEQATLVRARLKTYSHRVYRYFDDNDVDDNDVDDNDVDDNDVDDNDDDDNDDDGNDADE